MNLYIRQGSQHLARSLMNCLQFLVRIDYLTRICAFPFRFKGFSPTVLASALLLLPLFLFHESYFRIVVEVSHIVSLPADSHAHRRVRAGFPHLKEFAQKFSSLRRVSFTHAEMSYKHTYSAWPLLRMFSNKNESLIPFVYWGRRQSEGSL